ncbi:hypothetical protein OK074_4217 [Actinobacteria bacterium OK074]|nr:hypothetical protein OK074_4217 [Actinobacteria bacterium OK074]
MVTGRAGNCLSVARATEPADASVALVARRIATPGFEVAFLPERFRVRTMRRITAAYVRHCGLSVLLDDALLVVSELVGNAVEHGGGHPVGLRVAALVDELRIEVADGNPVPARRRVAGEADEDGRGLLLVDAVAREWGVSPDGTMTWCSLAIPENVIPELALPDGEL